MHVFGLINFTRTIINCSTSRDFLMLLLVQKDIIWQWSSKDFYFDKLSKKRSFSNVVSTEYFRQTRQICCRIFRIRCTNIGYPIRRSSGNSRCLSSYFLNLLFKPADKSCVALAIFWNETFQKITKTFSFYCIIIKSHWLVSLTKLSAYTE